MSALPTLAEYSAEIAAQWHPTKNTGMSPETLSIGSAKKIWWVCARRGHEYLSPMANRIKGGVDSCPYCSNRRVLVGFNDLLSQNPTLAAQLDSAKSGFSPDEVVATTRKKAWWRCDQAHSWRAPVSERSQGRGCPYCYGRYVIAGHNDLASQRPDVAKQWHPTKNHPLQPSEITVRNDKKVWWLCEVCGTEWASSVGNRTAKKGTGCPVCSGNLAKVGHSDLATLHPEIASLWHPTKNAPLKPEAMRPGSGKKVWWLGACGHEWDAIIKMVVTGSGCPFCSNSRVLPGFNDLVTTHPEIAAQWHHQKNGALLPENVMRGSDIKVWWKCEKEHEWDTWVYARAVDGNGCPRCSVSISLGEEEMIGWLRSLGVQVEVRVRNLLSNGWELDAYLPEHKVAIEFNGLYWHSETAGKNKDYHRIKHDLAAKAGVQLYQVWEDDWRDRNELVKRTLQHKLGLSTLERVPARKTTLVKVSAAEAGRFLDQWHLQGSVKAGTHLGLKDSSGKIVALMSVRQMSSGLVYIDRYATSAIVQGGFSKLLSAIIRDLKPSSVVTFADLTISNGDLYTNSGFRLDKILPPDYSYMRRGVREHKFNYRIKRFRTDPALRYEDGLTETELARLNNMHRIWDAGKARYVLDLT